MGVGLVVGVLCNQPMVRPLGGTIASAAPDPGNPRRPVWFGLLPSIQHGAHQEPRRATERSATAQPRSHHTVGPVCFIADRACAPAPLAGKAAPWPSVVLPALRVECVRAGRTAQAMREQPPLRSASKCFNRPRRWLPWLPSRPSPPSQHAYNDAPRSLPRKFPARGYRSTVGWQRTGMVGAGRPTTTLADRGREKTWMSRLRGP